MNEQTKPDPRKAAKLIRAGKKIQPALLEAGYSPWVARKGRGALKGKLRDAVADELGSMWLASVELGKRIKPDDVRLAVLGGIAQNLSERSDSGVQSLKLAGSLKELQMFQAEITTGIIVIAPPSNIDPAQMGAVSSCAQCGDTGFVRTWKEDQTWIDTPCKCKG